MIFRPSVLQSLSVRACLDHRRRLRYALPLIQKEVQYYGWMTPEEFHRYGIAIAEMTPGAIGVNTATFVGFRQAGFWGQ